MLAGGCWVTQSLDHALPWVFGPVVFLAGTATHLQLYYLVGVNFLFLTSGSLFTFPGRTCLPGDNSDASSPPTGYSRAQLSTALQPSSKPPPIWRRMGRAPALVQVLWGLIPAGPLRVWGTQEQATLWGASQDMPAWFAPWLQHNSWPFQCQPQGEQEESLPPAPQLRKRRGRR